MGGKHAGRPDRSGNSAQEQAPADPKKKPLAKSKSRESHSGTRVVMVARAVVETRVNFAFFHLSVILTNLNNKLIFIGVMCDLSDKDVILF